MWTRRKFLQTTSGGAIAAICLPRHTFDQIPARPGTRSTARLNGEPDLHTLAADAIDAARSAGAAYADVRLTFRRTQLPSFTEEAMQGIGVRVLVGGVWGFLSSATWTTDEAVRLAREAVAQATACRRGKLPGLALAPVPALAHGDWTMPVKYDPFAIPIGEKLDVMNAFGDFARSYAAGVTVQSGMTFTRDYHVGATSEGASWSQTKYLSAADFKVGYRAEPHANLFVGGATADFLSPAGRGWEHVADSGLLDRIPALIDFAEQSRHRKPVEVGRYDVVFTASALASILDQTLGAATELDRAMGYEANAVGTSYLHDPLGMLGQQRVGSPLVTVTANRSLPGGAATTKWDDEGVVPEDFTLVQEGVLIDYQTTRESAQWLSPYYQQRSTPLRSHGCMRVNSALDFPVPQSPNLQLLPGKEELTFEDLVASTEKGIAIYALRLTMDQQQLNGFATGVMREITHGKLGKFLTGGGVVFRAPEFWDKLVALGGSKTMQWTGLSRLKGEPAQMTVHSVGVPPGKVTQLSVVDVMRKA